MSIIIEIRAAEGGEDAKLLVRDQLRIYEKLCARHGLTLELVEVRHGYVSAQVSGRNAESVFANEAGGHRWQRVPPTEKRGRVQTSTITVAVLPEPKESELHIDAKDLDWKTCRGSGAGGQHRNKTETAVQLTYKPTGFMVRCETERSQAQNKETALSLLRARLWEEQKTQEAEARAGARKAQVGSGQRGDKRRTIQVQNGTVTDHVTGRTWRYKDYERGDW